MNISPNTLTEVAFTLQPFNLQAFEVTIEKLNTKIDDMPSVARVPRFDWDSPNFDPPQGKCQNPFQCGVNYLDPEVGWLNDVCPDCQEDLDYAEMCADEKFRSLH